MWPLDLLSLTLADALQVVYSGFIKACLPKRADFLLETVFILLHN